jgi:hypothetical protein
METRMTTHNIVEIEIVVVNNAHCIVSWLFQLGYCDPRCNAMVPNYFEYS